MLIAQHYAKEKPKMTVWPPTPALSQISEDEKQEAEDEAPSRPSALRVHVLNSPQAGARNPTDIEIRVPVFDSIPRLFELVNDLMEVDRAAFATNPLLCAVFPDMSTRAGGGRMYEAWQKAEFETALRAFFDKALPGCKNGGFYIWIAVDPESRGRLRTKREKVVGFAIWHTLDGVYTPGDNSTTKTSKTIQQLTLDTRYWNSEFQARYAANTDQIKDMIKTTGKWMDLDRLAVHPDYHRRGIGRRLLDEGLAEADRQRSHVYIESSDSGASLYSSKCERLKMVTFRKDQVSRERIPVSFFVRYHNLKTRGAKQLRNRALKNIRPLPSKN